MAATPSKRTTARFSARELTTETVNATSQSFCS